MARRTEAGGGRRAVRRLALGGVLLVLGAAGGTAGCKRGGAQEASGGAAGGTAASTPTVRLGAENVARVEAGEVRTGPVFSGRLQPVRAASVRAQTAGQVLEMRVEQGERVKPGQLLARLEPNASPAQLQAAREGVRAARDAVALARTQEARVRKLAQAGAVARQELERAQQQRVSAQAQLSQALAQAAAAGEQVGNTEVRAPFAGVVAERQVGPGDVVQPGLPLFTVVDPGSLQLEGSVPVQQLAQVRVGTTVSFTVTGFGGRQFTGRIERVNPVVDPATGQVRLYASVDNADGSLLGGLFAEGRVQSQVAQGLSVPLDAVDRTAEPPAVVRVKDGALERVAVKLGLVDEVGERALVQEGLQPGDVVALGGTRELPPGTRVELPALPPPAPQGVGGAGGAEEPAAGAPAAEASGGPSAMPPAEAPPRPRTARPPPRAPAEASPR